MKVIVLLIIAAFCFYEAFKTAPAASIVIVVLFSLWFYELGKNNNKETETSAEEPLEMVEHKGEEEYFPEPYYEDPPMIPDSQTCLQNVNRYVELADKARACGRDELAEQYEDIAGSYWQAGEETDYGPSPVKVIRNNL